MSRPQPPPDPQPHPPPYAWAKNARGNDVDTSGLEWSPSIGAWLTVAAAGAMVVISIVGIVKRR